MITENPLRWADPRSWPWFVYLWFAFLLAPWAKPALRWLRQKRAASWPITQGRITAAEVGKPTWRGRNSPKCEAEISYTYWVDGHSLLGLYNRDFDDEDDAREFIRDLKDKTIPIHYNPQNTSRSSPSESGLKAVQDSRPAPAPINPGAVLAEAVPQWLRPILHPVLWFFMIVAAVGFALSLWVQIATAMGRQVGPESLYVWLHVGCFVPTLPILLMELRLRSMNSGRSIWRILLRRSPWWMRVLDYGFVLYAIVNFLKFANKAQGTDCQTGVDWRSFSGHWMMFYGVTFTLLWTAAHLDESK